MKQRLDQALVSRGLVSTRSQAESYVRLGKVWVDGQAASKPGQMVTQNARLQLKVETQYVSRAALKLESVATGFGLDFRGKTILDVGSSTGGFTQFALLNGAEKVIAVDVGTDQLHPTLRTDPKVELHEQTDIRDYLMEQTSHIDMVLIDLSFISIREVLLVLPRILGPKSQVVAMVKPQFEVGDGKKHKGIIKNEAVRRTVLKDFEAWAKQYYQILDKADSKVSGEKGNTERFYLLRALKQIK